MTDPTEFERAIIATFIEDLRDDRLLTRQPTEADMLQAIRTCDLETYRRFITALAYRMPAACGELAQQWLLEVAHG